MDDGFRDERTRLQASYDWLLRSLAREGGSRAFYLPLAGWARPYPETTGYIIPTLLTCGAALGDVRAPEFAYELGTWLVRIQHVEGWWQGGLFPARRAPQPSIFNTAQILFGMCALHEITADARWLEAARTGAAWIARMQQRDGTWSSGNYRDGFSPSYYAHVAWPLALVARLTGDRRLVDASVSAFDAVVARRRPSGTIADWGFAPGGLAFTHTIAYTLRALLEADDALDFAQRYIDTASRSLEFLRDMALAMPRRFPGAFDESWRPDSSYTCLTGNAQLAICFVKMYARTLDGTWLRAAMRLVRDVGETQALDHVVPSIRGAIAGSWPPWGRYMRFRYPNWAAKYYCDALLALSYARAGDVAAARAAT